MIPQLKDLESQDLQIWESQTRGPLLRPRPFSSNRTSIKDQWRVEGGEEVLFQGFAKLKLQSMPEPIPCLILALFNERATSPEYWHRIRTVRLTWPCRQSNMCFWAVHVEVKWCA